MDTQTNEFIAIFLDEGKTRLSDLKNAVDNMTNSVTFSDSEKARIASHTIKGMSSQMGFNNISEVSKRIENFFIKYKMLGKLPDKESIFFVKQSVDLLQNLFLKLEKDGNDSLDISKVIEKMDELINQ